MQWPHVLFVLVVFCIGVPSMWKNATATALVAAWGLNEAVYVVTGDNLPFKVYTITDYMVLMVIFLKREALDCSPFRGLWHQLGACWRERAFGDRIVASIFPAMWIVYALAIGDYYKWWILWVLALGQFLAAGAEAFVTWRRGRNRDRADVAHPPDHLRFGWAGYV